MDNFRSEQPVSGMIRRSASRCFEVECLWDSAPRVLALTHNRGALRKRSGGLGSCVGRESLSRQVRSLVRSC